jgi:hypothetical protein
MNVARVVVLWLVVVIVRPMRAATAVAHVHTLRSTEASMVMSSLERLVSRFNSLVGRPWRRVGGVTGTERRHRRSVLCIVSKVASTTRQHGVVLRKAEAIHQGGAAAGSAAATETILLLDLPRRQ